MDSVSSSTSSCDGGKASGSPQAAGNHLNPSKGLLKGHNHGGEPKKNSRIERAWREMEEQLARIPIDGDGLGVRSDDEPYIAEILLRTEDPGIDYGLWRFMDRDEIPRWTQRHRWRAEWEQREKLKDILQRLDKQSFELGLTYCSSELPKRFRFALQRPLMPDEDLGIFLRDLDLGLTFIQAYKLHTKRSKRARQTLLGVDVHETPHVSGYYEEIIQSRNALTEAHDTYNPSVNQRTVNRHKSKPSMETHDTYNASARQPRQAKTDGQTEQQIKAACSVWGLFRAGEIQYTRALDQFRAILNDPEISDFDLAWRLEEFDIPMANFLGKDGRLELAELDEDEREIIQELLQCVKSYHTGACTLDKALTLICDCLVGMDLDRHMFSDLLDEEGYTEYEIATRIWERATQEPNQKSKAAVEDVDSPLVAGLSIEDLTADFVGKYTSKIVDGLDPGLALTEYREELGVEDFSHSQISYMLARVSPTNQVKPDEKDDITYNRIDDLPSIQMGPPSGYKTQREPSPKRNHIRSTAGRKIYWQGAFNSTAGNPMDPDFENLSSSPEQGVSDSLFGLALPTKEAKRIGQKIGLPADFVRSRIRSSTLKRANVRKRRKMSISVSSPMKKRRSETDIGPQNWFAKDGEDQMTFVRNNFSKESLLGRAVNKVLSEACLEDTPSSSHRVRSSSPPKRLVLRQPKPIKLKLSSPVKHPSSGQSSPSDSPPLSPPPWSAEPSPLLPTPLSTCIPSPYLDPKELPPNVRAVSPSPVNYVTGHERQIFSSENIKLGRAHSTDFDPLETLNRPSRTPPIARSTAQSEPIKRSLGPRNPRCYKRLTVSPESSIHGTVQDLQDWAFRERKSFFVMLEILRKRRKERTRTANANIGDDSYFQNSSSNSGSSSTSALNKLFDKYRGMPCNPPRFLMTILLTLTQLQIKQTPIQTPSVSKAQCATSETSASSLTNLSSSQSLPTSLRQPWAK